MKTENQADFSIDRENSTVHVKKEYAAPKADVWAAWTQPELLDKWWAPKPFEAQTKSMDFSEGGKRLYAMVGPKGEKHWSLVEFKSITPQTNFTYRDGFCDSEGNMNQDMPRSNWSVSFSESKGTTTVDVQIKHETPSDLEQIIKMGFKEGFAMTLDNLDALLKK